MKTIDQWKPVLVLVIVLILGFAVLGLLSFFKPYAFELNEKSVSFVSNEQPVSDGLKQFGQGSDFLVAVETQVQGPLNQYMSNSLNLFSVILIANHKEVTTLTLVKSGSNALLTCRTNRGDVLTDDELTVSQCELFEKEFEGKKIKVLLPNGALPKTQVVVSSNQVTVSPKNPQDIAIASFSTLVKMFENAQSQLDNINAVAGQIQN
ncbi:MAG: hypothetical protein V1777_01345 [Candidatus Micrarchaeota archaeon]